MSVTIYLDSSDYSRLADSQRNDKGINDTRNALLKLATDSRVRFVFSGAHLSEMAPLDGKYADAAIARADVLCKLCGGSALISFDKLMAAEIRKLVVRDAEPVIAVTTNGTWFPDLDDILPTRAELAGVAADEVDAFVRSSPANRRARRDTKRKLLKGKRPRAAMSGLIRKQDPSAMVPDIISRYPMSSNDAETLSRFILGRATRREAEEAFRHSLQDPRWLMRWFESHSGALSPLVQWMRAPAKKLAEELRTFVPALQEIQQRHKTLQQELQQVQRRFRERGKELGIAPGALASADLRPLNWKDSAETQLVAIVKRLIESRHPYAGVHIAAPEVDQYCPGLAVAIRTMYSCAADIFGKHTRTPKDSDFVDVIHALYAPYVTFFRADRYMAPHIQKHVRASTKIVSRLEELAEQIEDHLSSAPGEESAT